MKLPILSTASIAALAALATTASAASCIRQDNAVYTYIVQASGVPDIPGTCGGLWDNLKRFSSCLPSDTSCSGTNGNLVWQFNVGLGCDGGDVQSTWWEATSNDYGASYTLCNKQLASFLRLDNLNPTCRHGFTPVYRMQILKRGTIPLSRLYDMGIDEMG